VKKHSSPWKWILICVAVLVGAWIAWEAARWPDVEALRSVNPRTTAFIELYKDHAVRGGKKPRLLWIWTPSAKISEDLKLAVLVGEDFNFFSHRGFDLGEMKSALQDAWEEKELPRGASTLTQQAVKNLWLSPSRNPLRKVKEAILTRQMEKALLKKRILEIYLNIVEFGPGIYGAEAASMHYFKKHASELSPHEAAELAASLPFPKRWHPGSTSRNYARRVDRLERKMAKADGLLKYF
jgi:monofunctional biosynthetic peptidoglycan transglycosylase